MDLEGRWVSVCGKMPETEQRVLVLAAGKTIFGQPAVSSAVYEDNYPQQFCVHDDRFEFEVTHWMSLESEPRIASALKLSDCLAAALELLAEMDLALTVATEANKTFTYGWHQESPFQEKIYEVQLRYRELVLANKCIV